MFKKASLIVLAIVTSTLFFIWLTVTHDINAFARTSASSLPYYGGLWVRDHVLTTQCLALDKYFAQKGQTKEEATWVVSCLQKGIASLPPDALKKETWRYLEVERQHAEEEWLDFSKTVESVYQSDIEESASIAGRAYRQALFLKDPGVISVQGVSVLLEKMAQLELIALDQGDFKLMSELKAEAKIIRDESLIRSAYYRQRILDAAPLLESEAGVLNFFLEPEPSEEDAKLLPPKDDRLFFEAFIQKHIADLNSAYWKTQYPAAHLRYQLDQIKFKNKESPSSPQKPWIHFVTQNESRLTSDANFTAPSLQEESVVDWAAIQKEWGKKEKMQLPKSSK